MVVPAAAVVVEMAVGWAVGCGAADHGEAQTVEAEVAVVADVVALAVEATLAAVLGVEGLVCVGSGGGGVGSGGS